jgi:putative restriction endonuclease
MSNEVRFNEIDVLLERAIRRFGSAQSPGGSEIPFWHLKNDGFWVIEDEHKLPRRKRGDRPTKTALRQWNARGYVPFERWQDLVNTPGLVENLARHLLQRFWPVSDHAAILQHVDSSLSTSDKPSADG